MRGSYSEKFKTAVIQQVLVDGQTIQEVASVNGVSPVTIRKWLRQQQDVNGASRDEYESLKKRLQEVINERDTLRATIAILIKEESNMRE